MWAPGLDGSAAITFINHNVKRIIWKQIHVCGIHHIICSTDELRNVTVSSFCLECLHLIHSLSRFCSCKFPIRTAEISMQVIRFETVSANRCGSDDVPTPITSIRGLWYTLSIGKTASSASSWWAVVVKYDQLQLTCCRFDVPVNSQPLSFAF